MTALLDTNVLVYRYDSRFPAKQRTAEGLLSWGAAEGTLVVPHQAIVELVAVATRPLSRGGPSLLTPAEARREAEEILVTLPVYYPTEEVVHNALRAAALYQLSWFDAHLWSYAETFGVPEILSEDFEHGRIYGSVRVINPFLAAESVHESPARYG